MYNDEVMMTLETVQTIPLRQHDDGGIRFVGSRVTLDSVIYNYRLGATPEQIADSFPTLALADIYAAITYYLTHREAVENYLRAREAEAAALRHTIEATQDRAAIRERLLQRAAARRVLEAA